MRNNRMFATETGVKNCLRWPQPLDKCFAVKRAWDLEEVD